MTISTKCGTLDLSKHIDPQYIQQVLAMGSWSMHQSGYIMHGCYATKKKVRLHRLVYELAHGPIPADYQIDHIDRNRSNNYLSNLRVVTHQQNLFNTKAKGYRWIKNDQKYEAQIKINGKQQYLGRYDTEQEARAAYLEAKKIYHII